jgi:gluconate 2-dehydrogenase gamma chain
VGWKAIGFPGAHYDYSGWVEKHDQPWPHPPVGLKGRPEWRGA